MRIELILPESGGDQPAPGDGGADGDAGEHLHDVSAIAPARQGPAGGGEHNRDGHQNAPLQGGAKEQVVEPLSRKRRQFNGDGIHIFQTPAGKDAAHGHEADDAHRQRGNERAHVPAA